MRRFAGWRLNRAAPGLTTKLSIRQNMLPSTQETTRLMVRYGLVDIKEITASHPRSRPLFRLRPRSNRPFLSGRSPISARRRLGNFDRPLRFANLQPREVISPP